MTFSTTTLKKIDTALFFAAFASVAYALYMIFVIVPNERIMGPIQRIFYTHVGSAFACYFACAIIFVTSLLYLASRELKFDIISHAAGEVGFLFCTIVLVSGMIWGHTAWNTWFRWEPRLITFLLLWFILLSFVMLRAYGEPGKIAAHSAVLGILGAITVPIIIYSIKLLPAAAQLHPQVIENRGLDSSFAEALVVTIIAMILLELFLIRLRIRIEHLYRGS